MFYSLPLQQQSIHLSFEMEKFCMLFLVIFLGRMASPASGAAVPAMFIFGDSYLDPGNNNRLLTLAKANYLPYGIDFPGGVTGRWSNGKTIADYLASFLELDLIPAFNDPNTKGLKILHGVNFASGSSGILNSTSLIVGQRIPLFQQVQSFRKKIIPSIQSLPSFGATFLAKSLFVSNMGNNDILMKYMAPLTNPLNLLIPPNYNDILIKEYRTQLNILYSLGARKFLVIGLLPLGCIPNVRFAANVGFNECYEPYNEITEKLNAMIKVMVEELNRDLSGLHMIYWDIYTTMKNIIDNPLPYGIKNSRTTCCNGIVVCAPGSHPCPNRSEFVFWDTIHITDISGKICATQAYGGIIQARSPMNVKQLAEL